MSQKILYHAAVVATFLVSAAIAGSFLYGWFVREPDMEFEINLPGRDGRPEGIEASETAVDLKGNFESFEGTPASLAGEWPRFRGAAYDNICRDTPPLADKWGDGGPKVFWSVELGEGHAAPVVRGGRVYLIDYDESRHADAVRCFSLEDGREIWRRSYVVSVKRNHGMSRTVPAVTESLLVTMGPRCHVLCLDPATGDFRWGTDLQRDHGAVEPLWYTGQCPLIDGDAVILAPGGPDALLMGLDGMTGQVLWKTPNPKGWAMSHSSVIPMTVAGVRMYVYSALGAVVGVAADGEARGALLWEAPWKARVIAPSPVRVDENRILITAGYGEGSMMLRLTNDGGTIRAETLYSVSPKEGIACEQQTPIVHRGLLYTVMPKDAGALREQFACYHPDGHLVWSSGPENRYGLGPFILADDRFYVLSDDGVLSMLKCSEEKFEIMDSRSVLDGHDAWGPIALAGSRMLLRDSKRMICIEAGKTGGEEGS